MIVIELNNSKNQIDKLIADCLNLQTERCVYNYLSNKDNDALLELKNRVGEIIQDRVLNSDEKLQLEKLICSVEILQDED